jgi:hypothetical protein
MPIVLLDRAQRTGNAKLSALRRQHADHEQENRCTERGSADD